MSVPHPGGNKRALALAALPESRNPHLYVVVVLALSNAALPPQRKNELLQRAVE